MPRQARKKSESGTYHILIRGINRQGTSATEFQALSVNIRNRYLEEFKEKGLSVRQIERLTGINRGLVKKHRKVLYPRPLGILFHIKTPS